MNRKENWQGMNWIRQEKRLAIYLRDNLACVWCGDSVENGAQFSLDHVKPFCKGGKNETENLITACSRCNSSRGKRTIKDFAAAVANYINHGATADRIIKNVRNSQARKIDVKAAKAMIAKRGSVAKVLKD